MRQINKIIIHCADTYPNMDVGVDEIRSWHLQKSWSDIGYHWVIKRDGTLQEGRRESMMGAHAKGHNVDSIGICLVGGKGFNDKPEFNFTYAQMDTLAGLVDNIKSRFENLDVMGHNEVSSKTCPNFDVRAFFS